MLIEVTERDHLLFEDLWGILTVINQHYERHPEAFGDEKTRVLLKAEVVACQKKHRLDRAEFYQAFAALLERHQLNPFADLSLAYVGGWRETDGGKYEQTIARAMPIVEKFGAFHDISTYTKGDFLTLENALAMTGGSKVDYLVTGNVLNAPDNSSPDDMILACANLLKRGGRAIHLLAYGEGNNFSRIGNHDLERFAGQRHLYNVPEGDYMPHAMSDKGNTEMMVLEQQREVLHTGHSLTFFGDHYMHTHPDAYYAPGAYDPHAKIVTSDGEASITRDDYYRYYFQHPEQLVRIHGACVRDFENPRSPLTSLQRDDAIRGIAQEIACQKSKPFTTVGSGEAQFLRGRPQQAAVKLI